MPEIDPFLDQVRQGTDYLRGLVRVPLRRGMAVAGGFALLAGSLSACGDSPDARAEGTQVGAGVAIESESPDNTGASLGAGETTSAAATESPNSTPAPAETPLAETQVAPSPTSTAEATISAEPTTENQEESGGLYDLIEDSTVLVEVTCLDSKINTVKLDSYAGAASVEGFSANLWLECGGSGVAVARLVLDVDDISPTGGALFGISDPTLVGGVVAEDGFTLGSENLEDATPYNTRYELQEFNNLDERSQCWLIGLQDRLEGATARVSIESLDNNNNSVGAQEVSCATVPPGVVW